MSDVTYRWIDGVSATEAEWDTLERVMAVRGWASLNRPTSRVLVAEIDGVLVGFHCLTLFPHAEPQWVIPSQRGKGVSEELAERMMEFLAEVRVRGFMVVADSPFAEELCKKHGMRKITSPVYAMLPEGS
jgi:hypothetical protein